MPDKKVNIKQITDYLPDPENANEGTEYGAHVIEKSVRELGPGRSLLADKNNVLIAGNKTQQALIDAGITEVIEITPEPGQVVVVKRPDLDLLEDDEEQTARRMAYTDNRASEVSLKWDAAQILEDMKNGIPLNDVFTEAELIGFGAIEPKEEDFKPDKAEALRDKWGVEVGQLWQLGDHRVICGDCTDAAAVERLMGGERVDCVLTSPPYNQGGKGGDLASHRKTKVKLYEEFGDNLNSDVYMRMLLDCLIIMGGMVADTHSVIWNVSYNSKSRSAYGEIVFSKENPFTVFETIIWDKKNALNIQHAGIYSRRCELIFVMSIGEGYLTSHIEGITRWNYWDIPIEPQSKIHRAAFSVTFAERAIKEFSYEGNYVYDPFLGTGTSLIACENLGRYCRGTELMPEYLAVTLERYHQHTGETPELLPAQS